MHHSSGIAVPDVEHLVTVPASATTSSKMALESGDPAEPGPSDVIADVLVTAADELGDPSVENPDDVLARLVDIAVRLVPGVEGAGIIQAGAKKQAVARAASVEWAGRLDRRQLELGEGPAPEVATGSGARIVDAADLTGDDRGRWPRWALEATAAGVTGALSIALTTHHRPRATLTFYSTNAEEVGASGRLLVKALAAQAGVALGRADRTAALTRGLESRDVIGQAKGILMERHRVTAEDAFAMLRRASQDTNLKLVAVATWLTEEHGDQKP